MKILLDECLPKRLKLTLPGHQVSTVQEMGWSGNKNGALLKLFAPVFDVFITLDGNLQFQQNLRREPISFIILSAPNSKYSVLQPLMLEVAEALSSIKAGDIVRIKSKQL